jgi:transcription-repair coupling factor (superfamily II helicase)
LPFQHFETFKQRFAPFPLTVEMISRFRTPKQVKEMLQRVEAGKVDILIGTHRLLSKDVKFADLGLLVVDEEQRFGVRHKERIKQMRTEVDVLTMSATPIPRTLHMSLVGLRDMSVIETPPKDRMAIQTVVANWDEKLIQSAIEQELDRGGQVYFVHNRIDTIWEIAAKIQTMVPKRPHCRGPRSDGRRGTGKSDAEIYASRSRHPGLDHDYRKRARHSALQYDPDQSRRPAGLVGALSASRTRGPLEPARLCIPALALGDRVDADRATPACGPEGILRPGAGFKIAALDLELRGAGNLLGGEQSGHIEAVGFELYTQMLERAVREMKGEAGVEVTEIQLNLGLNIRIPSDYIKEENQRLRMYKRVAGVETESQLHDVRAELIDRYGETPRAVRNLLDYAALKLQAMRVGANAIERKREFVSIKFSQTARLIRRSWRALWRRSAARNLVRMGR